MAKITDKTGAEPSPAAMLTFRDKVSKSRTLIIPDTGRTLPVAKGLVEVSVSDEQAVSYLKANEEFELLE